MKKLIVVLSFLVICSLAVAVQNRSYDWEDGIYTALGKYEGGAVLTLENSTEQAKSGTHSLKMVEDPQSGTPQAYIWWIIGLTDGDIIDAQFYCYDETPGGSPSGRIWGHYTPPGGDINSYSGSASGNSTYSDGSGWSLLSYSWTFDSNTGANDGLIVEARIYSSEPDLNTLYIDSTAVTVSSDTAVIWSVEDMALPITLSSFTAVLLQQEELINITWITESEFNMSHFNLYRDEQLLYSIDATNTTQTTVYEYEDGEIEDGETYSYLLEAVHVDLISSWYGPVTCTVDYDEPEVPEVPVNTRLWGNYPNPFNPDTVIRFDVKGNEEATLKIYNARGQLLLKENFVTGEYNYEWNAGKYGSGVYMYELESNSYSEIKKMVMTK